MQEGSFNWLNTVRGQPKDEFPLRKTLQSIPARFLDDGLMYKLQSSDKHQL
jgi:hypothetical protein